MQSNVILKGRSMKSSRFIMLYLCCFIGCFSSYSQESKTVFTFDGDRLTAGLVQVMGAGFGEQPLADVTYGPIPEDNASPEQPTAWAPSYGPIRAKPPYS